MQEYDKFNGFCNSLLGRTTKLADLCQQLESALDEAEKAPDSSEGQRVAKSKTKFFPCHLLTSLGSIFLLGINRRCSQLRCVQALERASETLEKEYESCEQVKLDVSALKSRKDLEAHERQEFLNLGIELLVS